MDNKIAIPSVEVIENGERVPSERIDPAVASFIAQMAQTAQLVKIRALEESKVPKGSKFYPLTATPNLQQLDFPNPCISFALINDGPGAIRVVTNRIEGAGLYGAIVLLNETYGLDFRYPILYRLYYQTIVAATLAAVRLTVIEGSWALWRKEEVNQALVESEG